MPALRATFVTTVVLMLSATAIRADTLSDAVNQLQYAYLTEDTNGLLQARSVFEEIAGDPARASISQYYVAYASYRLAQLSAGGEKERLVGYIDDCIVAVNGSLDDNPGFADAIALESACHGMKASAQPLKLVVYGPMSLREMGRAKKLAPDNPRIMLLEGIGVYSRPRVFAGGIDKARAKLEQAVGLFSDWVAGPGEPEWGYAEAQAFLGEIYYQQGMQLEARNALEQALIIAPEYAWARRRLDQVLSEIRQGDITP